MNRKFTNFETDESIAKYFKDVKKSVILTSKEEINLAKRIKKGDKKAMDELINANLKFVISIAKDYQGQGLLLSDLISEGNYGLIKAAHKFDHRRGFRFISYAVWWIKQSIIQSLNDNARVVRLPANVINKISRLNREISKFENDNEKEPIYGDILSNERNMHDLSKYPKISSLNQIINEDGDELVETVPSETDDSDQKEIDGKIKDELFKMLNILDNRERIIIESYYGVNRDCESMTLEAIGEQYGLTKERIRQIKNSGLRKLRFNASALLKIKNY
jgi:RNA polymerase primary sigma factor